MRKKKVFIVEDQDNQRKAIGEALVNRGFEVYEAKRVSEARKIAEQHWKDFDVAVLDMRLEDPKEPNITGADIGIEFHKKNETSPECIIFSAYAEVEYYKLALELGVAAYLDKNKFGNPFDVVRHVKTVALHKALNVENSETMKQVIRIVTHSSDRAHAVKMFCRKVFAPELKICLGTPFFLILTSDKQSEFCAGDIQLPRESGEIYDTLQTIAQGEKTNPEPEPLNLTRLSKETKTEISDEYKILEGAMLLPVFYSKEHLISLTLVLLKEPRVDPSKFRDGEYIPPPNKVTEDPKELWKVLNQYLKPTVVEHLLTIFSAWNHIKSTLREISQICIWIGQEQASIMKNSLSLDDSVINRLRAMAHDLTESGNLLSHIEKPLDETIEYPSLSAKEILDEVWEDIKLAEELDNEFIFEIESNCNVEIQENDLYVVFSRLLQWFVKRRISTSSDIKPTIKILCQTKENESVIVFTDKSNRLPQTIRKELFVPFTQSVAIPFRNLSKDSDENHIPGQYLPLYIAKMIVEIKYGGELVDCSDELEGDLGHKLVLRFPKEPLEV